MNFQKDCRTSSLYRLMPVVEVILRDNLRLVNIGLKGRVVNSGI